MRVHNIRFPFDFEQRNPISLAIGNFDGVHLGHKNLINVCLNQATQEGLEPSLMTFNPHPKIFLSNRLNDFFIMDLKLRNKFFQAMGIKNLFVLEFNDISANMSPVEFIENILHKLNIKYLSVGFNFKFGKNGSGDFNLLEKLCKNINCQKTNAVIHEGSPISSTRIRDLISYGKIEEANILLGHNLSILAKVTNLTGQRIKLSISKELILPKSGYYEINLLCSDQKHSGILYISFGHNDCIEIKLTDALHCNIGENIELEVIKSIKPAINFITNRKTLELI